MKEDKNRVCPVEQAGSLDNKLRRWLQNPQKILTPYIKEGMKVLDVGCGPGFFSIELAKMVGPNGKVFAADLQEGMLNKLRAKVSGSSLEQIIQTVKCEEEDINIAGPVDFILAFYMVHEVPNKAGLFKSLKNILNENGALLVVEPKMFHVSKKEFEASMRIADQSGFKVSPGPKLAFSFSSILQNAEN